MYSINIILSFQARRVAGVTGGDILFEDFHYSFQKQISQADHLQKAFSKYEMALKGKWLGVEDSWNWTCVYPFHDGKQNDDGKVIDLKSWLFDYLARNLYDF